MKKQSGFSLIEVLLGLVLTVIVLGAASTIFTSSGTLYRKQAEDADQQQALAAGLAQMSYELGLAGYRGTDLNVNQLSSRNFGGQPTVKINQGEHSDIVTVRYYEDKWTSNNQVMLKEVSFFIYENKLMRQEGAVLSSDGLNLPKSIVDDVVSIKVVYWLNKYGTRIPLLDNLDRSVARGLVIKLAYKDGGDELFTVAFQNQQRN